MRRVGGEGKRGEEREESERGREARWKDHISHSVVDRSVASHDHNSFSLKHWAGI